MGEEYPPHDPLSYVSQHLDACECPVKTRTIGIADLDGSPFYQCQDCGGYIP